MEMEREAQSLNHTKHMEFLLQLLLGLQQIQTNVPAAARCVREGCRREEGRSWYRSPTPRSLSAVGTSFLVDVRPAYR